MFFKHSKKGTNKCADNANGIVSRFPESPVNPMYKPRTLSELRALFEHTGINPAPVALRDGIKEDGGFDPMDLPPIPIGGDIFETIRTGQSIQNDLRNREESYHASQSDVPSAKEVQQNQAE